MGTSGQSDGHACSFLRGMNWHTYKYLETRMLETSRYVTFAPENVSTWSENFADLLILTGSAVDSFFRDMGVCPCVATHPKFIDAKKGIGTKKRKWDIHDFMKAYEPVYELSKNEVSRPFGLSNLGTRTPFKSFADNRPPVWWSAYNHIKHEYYSKITEATLENILDALGALLILNALHKDSQKYLVTIGVIQCEGVDISSNLILEELEKSMIGYPKGSILFGGCLITTPIFLFRFREDSG